MLLCNKRLVRITVAGCVGVFLLLYTLKLSHGFIEWSRDSTCARKHIDQIDSQARGSSLTWAMNSVRVNALIKQTPTTTCKNFTRYGKDERPNGHNGHVICLDDIPATDCLVYSMGIRYDFEVDGAMAKNHGCDVRSYDPSMQTDSLIDPPPGVKFEKIGISDKDETIIPAGYSTPWKMKTLETMLNDNGHKGRMISLLKMDIELNEWPVLAWLIERPELFMKIKQLDMEVHLSQDWPSGKLEYAYDVWRTFINCTPFRVVDLTHWRGSIVGKHNMYMITMLNTKA